MVNLNLWLFLPKIVLWSSKPENTPIFYCNASILFEKKSVGHMTICLFGLAAFRCICKQSVPLFMR